MSCCFFFIWESFFKILQPLSLWTAGGGVLKGALKEEIHIHFAKCDANEVWDV